MRILLFAGTAESEETARRLLQAECSVVVCTATDYPLSLPDSPALERVVGKLDQTAMRELICKQHIEAVVDITHPYAGVVSQNAEQAARDAGVDYFRYERPASAIKPDASTTEEADGHTHLHIANDADEAARIACSFRKTIFLTTGANAVAVFAAAAQKADIRCVARVLPAEASLQACRAAGLSDHDIVAEQGPFSFGQNIAMLKKFGAGVIVTKDGGSAGGLQQKLDAARQTGCQIVLWKRPQTDATASNHYASLDTMLENILRKN